MRGKYHDGAVTRHNAAASFRLGAISIGLRNKDFWGRLALAEAKVTVRPVEFTGYVHADGKVVLPPCLRDEELRDEIAPQLRGAGLQAIACRFIDQDQREQPPARRGAA